MTQILFIALLNHQLSPSAQLSVISVLFSTIAYNGTTHQEFYWSLPNTLILRVNLPHDNDIRALQKKSHKEPKLPTACHLPCSI